MEDRHFVTRDQYDGRNQVVDERFARDKERIETTEVNMQKVQTLTIEMAALNKKHDDQIGAHEKRISCLEQQPADQYSKIKLGLVSAIAGGLLMYLLNAILPSVKP